MSAVLQDPRDAEIERLRAALKFAITEGQQGYWLDEFHNQWPDLVDESVPLYEATLTVQFRRHEEPREHEAAEHVRDALERLRPCLTDAIDKWVVSVTCHDIERVDE